MIRLLAPITKIDVERRLVIGRLAQEVPDRAREILDYDSSKPYFKAWSEGFAKATTAAGQEVSFGNLRAMHGTIAAGKFTRVDFNDTDKAIDVIAKVVDDQEWKKCEEGVYTAFSIGGDYVGEKKAEKVNGVTHMRYTANPGEGSLVDSPCIPTAKFFEIVKADGTTLQKAFNPPEHVPTIEEQNAVVEKVARRLARVEFWKQTPGLRVQLPEDLFEKMADAEKAKMSLKHPPDENWQAHILEAIRLVKAADYNSDEEDLEKPDEIDQEDWDNMDYEEKLEAVDEYEKAAAAAVQKVDDEKDMIKPADIVQDDWDSLSVEGKKKVIDKANAVAAEKAAQAALEKAEQDEMKKDGAGGKAEKDLEKPADVAQGDWDEMDGVQQRKAVEAAASRAAKAAGASDTTLNAVDELAKLLDSGKVSAEGLLDLAKREFSGEERDKAADKGQALPDGSFPIKSVSDLENAVQAYGRAKDKEAAKAHIISRAKALGATDKLPQDWSGSTKGGEKASTGGDVEKNMYNVQSFAMALQALANVCASAQYDLNTEGDDSPIPEQLRGWIASGTKIFCDMAEEEADELVEGLQRYSSPGVPEAMALRALATMHKVDNLRNQLEDPKIPLVEFHKIAVEAVGAEEWKHGGYFQKYIEDRATCIEDILTKAGARHSAEDKEHLQQAHDHLCKLGAACSADHLPPDAAEKLNGSGSLFKLALQSAEQISVLESALAETQAEVKKLRDQPARPRGVVRAIAKGEDVASSAQAITAAERAAAEKAAKAAASPPKEGEHNPARAIELVREQVAKTAGFRNLA